MKNDCGLEQMPQDCKVLLASVMAVVDMKTIFAIKQASIYDVTSMSR